MSNKFITSIKESRPVSFLFRITKKIVLPGFEGVPIFYVLKFFIKGLIEGSITQRAASISFSFFLALFPSIIFFFTLIPYIPIDNFQNELLDVLQSVIPSSAYDAVAETLEDIITRQHGGLLSFGFLAALLFSTSGFASIITAFNTGYHQIHTRSILSERLISLILVIILFILIVAAITLLVYTEFLLNQVSFLGGIEAYLIKIGRWVILFALFFTVISFIYYLGPSSKTKWRFVNVGSTFCTLLSVFTSIGFAYYVNNFSQYNKLYGSIGTLLIVLLWIYINSIMLLLGFELNASISNAKSRELLS